MENSLPKKEIIWKGTEFWIGEMKKARIELPFVNDVITGHTPPNENSGYHLVVPDVKLDGRTCDIYNTDQDEEGNRLKGHSWHRIFIHIKE
jgi:hypothetical protein